MSVTDESTPESEVPLEDLPAFELSYLFDSGEDPTEVTVFPASNSHDISTNWITIDVGHAVPLDEIT